MSESAFSHLRLRRQLIAALLASAGSAALAGAPVRSPRPHPRTNRARIKGAGPIDDILGQANLSGKLSFVVADAGTGEVLESHNPEMALPPASVTKTVTTLYGLSQLGSDFRFPTKLVAHGELRDGRLAGDLYLVGGGDPTLDTDALGALAKRLKDAGLREVAGKTYVWGGALPYQKYIDPGQPEYLGYNPALSGLNLNYNRVFFEWKRAKSGYLVTMDARALKFRPRVTTSTMTVVDRRSPVFAVRTTRKADDWTVAKRALGSKGGRWLPVRRPTIYAAGVFRTIARSYGIDLPAFEMTDKVPTGTVLAEWHSRPLRDVLKSMLKYSTNLVAEAVGTMASRRQGAYPSTLRASARVMTGWAKRSLGVKRASFVDHSGLEDASRISAGDMVRVLAASGWDGPLHRLMKAIPMRDAKGRVLKNSRIRIRAKTGTLNFVSALAGYVETASGRRLIFAVFAADMAHRSRIRRADKERPKGARAWNRRAKILQQRLIERWATTFQA